MDLPPDGEVIGPEVARAEELVEELTQNVSRWLTRTASNVLKRVALAREEAEDMLAEAQALNRRERS